jgi:hypothetical protein
VDALLGVARSQRALRHAPAAYDAYELALSAHEPQLTREEKRAAQEAIAELALLTGTLAIDVSETDAELEVDGRPWGHTPMAKPHRVRAAPHTVRVTKAGYSTFEQSVVVAAQEAKRLEVKLDVDPSAATQQLSEADRKASARAAFADGVELQDHGDCPRALARFETAERLHDAPTHLLHLAQCQATLGKLVEAQESYATLDHITLSAQAPDAFREAQETGRAELSRLRPRVPTLRLETVPPAPSLKNLVIQINGARIPSDLVGIARPVNPGRYHVTVTAAPNRSATGDVEINEGDTRSVELRLAR